MSVRSVQEWKDEVRIVLESKRNEFESFGYQEITIDSIWQCLIERIWEKDEQKRLYEVVQSILQLPIHTYMDFLALHLLHQKPIETDDELMESIQAVMNREK